MPPPAGLSPLYMIMKLAQSPEDARTVVEAVAAVRTCRIRRGNAGAFDPRICAMFTKVGPHWRPSCSLAAP